ncbi:MAG: aminotransferase class III-fold pyridoxal phosphate-dependent enzyme, partial [Chloroflexia bacterium]
MDEQNQLLKLDGHFRLYDAVTPAQTPPYDRAAEGVPGSVASQTLSVPPTVADVERALETEPNVAALILEPSGATYAAVPLAEGFLRAVRELTAAHDVLLIFDEVVTGFRWSPGGAQELYGVAPDLTT